MNYRAGIIGCGRIGCSFDDDSRRGYTSSHAGAYKRTEGIELVALCDVEKGKAEHYGLKFDVPGRYTNYHEMFRSEQLDIVSLCTWDYTHLDLVAAAVSHRVKAIFCEKPIAQSLEAADKIIRLCAENGVILAVDHQRRFDPFHQRLACFLREGGLGRIQQVTCYYTAGVANSGSHLFDLLRFYLGDVAWAEGRTSSNLSPNPDDPNIDGWLGFVGGPTVAVQACDVASYLIFEICLLGTRGRLCVKSSGFDVEFEEARGSQRFAGYKELFPANCPVQAESSHEFMLDGMAHLRECIRTGQEPISKGEDGRASLEIICALRESAKQGSRRILLPLKHSSVNLNSR